MANPQVLETHAEWHRNDIDGASDWIETLTHDELDELDQALHHAQTKSDDLREISKDDFPLGRLKQRLKKIEGDLINGRGFVQIRGIPRQNYTNDEMCMLYWGIGMYLGDPWPQNKYGHILGDVTDQGKDPSDNTSRGNELGGIALPYHSDGSDLVGLMCLQKARSGGASAICNAVAVHNDLVRQRPDLAAEMYKPQPYDYRGEQKEGSTPFYEIPTFTKWADRLFVRYIRPYILASQRHDDAPRITPLAEEAMQMMDEMCNDPHYNTYMDLAPGDIQFINNYHVLHARKEYVDDPETGEVRHLKRLWLATNVLEDRPPHFQSNVGSHWGKKKTVSRLDAAE